MSLFSRLFKPEEPEKRSLSISDPGILPLFGIAPSVTGVSVDEFSTLGVASVFRAVTLIAGGIAKLPLHSVSQKDGVQQQVPSWLDNPSVELTKFELIETTLLHLLLHGNAYLAHVYGGAGQLIGVQPIHPIAVSLTVDSQYRKTFRVTLIDGTVETFNDDTMTHIKGVSSDSIRGLSPLTLARNGMFGTSIAADRSAGKMFGDGALMSALVMPEGDTPLTEEDADQIRKSLTVHASGVSNAGRISLINRNLKFTPWSLSNEDAQWLQSRQFEVEEVARWYGIPPHMIGLTEKQSSWGTGVAEMGQVFAKFTLSPWTSRIEDRLSPLLPRGQVAQFDFHDLLSPDPVAATGLLIQKVEAGLMTPNEARHALNMPPLPNGDVPRIPPPTAPPAVSNEPV